MNPSPQVSVIVPTVDRAELLLECVESILRNDFTDFEILVVDQDPDKGLSAQLSARFEGDSRINYLSLDEASASKARNLGIRHARGEILAFVDDDLEVDTGWLGAYVSAFASVEPRPGMLGGRVDPLWASTRPGWLPEEREYLLGLYNKGKVLVPMPDTDLPITANCAVPRAVVDEVGTFDERIGFSYSRKRAMIGGEDSLFSLAVKRANYSIYYQPHARAWHKISKNKLTKRHFLRRNFWEGVTTLVVLYLSGSISSKDFPGTIRWHIRNIVDQLFCFFIRGDGFGVRLLDAKEWMRLGATCLHSLGTICYCLKFLWARTIP